MDTLSDEIRDMIRKEIKDKLSVVINTHRYDYYSKALTFEVALYYGCEKVSESFTLESFVPGSLID